MSERTVKIGLEVERLTDSVLADICERVDFKIRTLLGERIGERFVEDLNVTVTAEVKGDQVIFTVDLSFAAPRVLELDYEAIVEEAVEEAFRTIEEELKKYAKGTSVEVKENTGQ